MVRRFHSYPLMCVGLNAGEPESTIGPCELFGFGLGYFMINSDDSTNTHLCYKLTTDLNHIVVNNDGVKTLKTVAQAMFDSEMVHGLAGTMLQGHTLTPLVHASEAALHRYHVAPTGDVWSFAPDPKPLPDDPSVAARLTELGAFATDDMCWPTEYAKITWEVQLDTTPPPSYNLLKPKLWLTHSLTMQPGKWYPLK